jgi:hypothetical protein
MQWRSDTDTVEENEMVTARERDSCGVRCGGGVMVSWCRGRSCHHAESGESASVRQPDVMARNFDSFDSKVRVL